MDDDLFSQEMQGVKPLENPQEKKRVARDASGASAQPNLSQRAARQAAVKQSDLDGNPLADNFIPEVEPHDLLEYNKPGIQHGVLKRMRTGRYEIDARLDLHEHTIEQARVKIFEFVNDCLRYDVRTALVVHGKGEKSQPTKAIIKSCVNYWLRELPDVLAFHSAQPQHGGTGAVYVLLRKSDSQKEKARERFRE